MPANSALNRTERDVLRSVFDETFQLMWLVHPDGTVADVNRRALTCMGSTYDVVVGNRLWELLWWTQESADQLRMAFSHSETAIEELTLQARDPQFEPLWLEFSLKGISATGNGDRLLLAEAKDITLRQQTLARLRAAESMLEEGQMLARVGSWVVEGDPQTLTSSAGLNRLFGFAHDLKSIPIDQYRAAIHPEDRDMLARIAAEHAETGKTPEYDMRIIRPNGETRVLHGVWRAELSEDARTVRYIGTSQDVTEQREAEARRARSLERLSTLTTMAQSLTARWHREGLYEYVIELITSLVGADSVLVMMHESGQWIIRGFAGATARDIVGKAIESQPGIAARTWQTGEAVVLNGEEIVSSLHETVAQNLTYRPRSLVAVPMVWEAERVGVIEIMHAEPDAFTDEDINLLKIVGAWVTIALSNARLWEDEKRARRLAENRRERVRQLAHRIVSTQEAERKRIGRELHDETGQVLTALKMKLSVLRRLLKESDYESELVEALEMINDMMKNVRHIAHDLRPPALDTFGLEAALEGMTGEFSRHSGIHIRYEGESVPQVSDDTGIAIYRFVQEALTNIGKHSGATEAIVTLRSEESRLVVKVRDNGKGFDLQQNAQGMGLAGMEERLDWLEGSLSIESAPGRGTILTASVPLQTH